MSIPGVLAGRTALLLRSVDRASATIAALRERGARAALCQLIDFELPADTTELDAGLRRMLAGGFDWCVFTSVNTLTALSSRALDLGLELLLPAGTRVAVVGEATANAARALGLRVDFVPESDHSARGMLASWPALAQGPATVFAPQADLASSTLRDGFTAHGWDALIVVAYNTVPAPADPARAVQLASAPAAALPPGAHLLAVADLAAGARGIDAVFFSSPSTVERYLAVAPFPPADAGPALIAIGDSTAARLREHGLKPTAIAALPTPAGMVDAWESALVDSRGG